MFDRQETEFDIAYPLSKIDFVASRSFPVGGMENWGVVIFHHNMLLLDRELQGEYDVNILSNINWLILDSNLSVELIAEQYKIEKIITHEISHQWFGNLVYMVVWIILLNIIIVLGNHGILVRIMA
jgi:aminopeptidase N